MAVSNDSGRYLLNNLYNEDLVTEHISNLQNHMFDPILRGKASVQGNQLINGDILDIQVNQSLNLRFGMPMNTFSIFLNINIIPFYSEKEFYFKYGYETPITTSQIMEDDKVFSKYIYFFMSGYLMHDVEYVMLKGGHTIIFIHPHEGDVTGEVHKDDLHDIMFGKDEYGLWTIMLGTRSDVYSAKKQKSALFNGNKIYLSSFTHLKKYEKPHKNNCYTMYITAFLHSYKIMTACNVTVAEDAQGEHFVVPQEFRDFIYSRTNNVFCLIFNEPECTGSGIYVDTVNDQPIFQIPYEKNPIPLKNLVVWRYDNETHRKLHPIEADATIHYPNIYDFNNMIDATYFDYLCEKSKAYIVDKNAEYFITGGRDYVKRYDLYIEWVEPMQDCMLFKSYISDYIDYEPDYIEMVANNNLPEEFQKNFNPVKRIKLSAFDYFKSEFYGDYRGWQLDCLSQMLHYNPKWYDELYHTIYYKVRETISRCYSYEKEPEIYERSIENNYVHCDGDSENKLMFTVPHTYLHIPDEQDKISGLSLFIGGKIVDYTYALKRGPYTYIYFKKEYLNNKENIHIDVELASGSIENATIAFNATGSAVDMERLNLTGTHSLSNLVMYNNDGSYIPPESFKYSAQVKDSDIAYDGDKNIDSALYNAVDFYTKHEEMFTTIDGPEGLILKEEEIIYEIEQPESSKNDDLNNVMIRPADSSLYGRSIKVGTTDFFQKKVFPITESLLNPVTDTYDFIYLKFKGKPDPDRFRVYADGLLITTTLYTIEFSGYDKDATFHFDKSLAGKKMRIQYLAYNEDLIFDGTIDKLLKVDGKNILFLRDILTTPYDKYVYKVYLDGHRITDDEILTLGQSNMIYINKAYNNASNLMIYKQKMDKEIYGYDKDTQFLDMTAMKDPNFLQFLIDKYITNRSGS